MSLFIMYINHTLPPNMSDATAAVFGEKLLQV